MVVPLLRHQHYWPKMDYRILSLFLLLLLTITCGSVTSQESSPPSAAALLQKSWTLYHSLSGSPFAVRGKVHMEINVNNIKNNDDYDDLIEFRIQNNEDCLDPSAMSSGKSMRDAWYQIKLVPDDEDATADGDDGLSILASVPACLLRRANFRDELSLTLGQNGQVLSMAYMPLVSPLSPKDCSEESMTALQQQQALQLSPPKLVSKISYEMASPGMVLRSVLPQSPPPPGLVYFKTSRSAAAGGGGGGGGSTTMGTSTTPPPSITGGMGGDSPPPPDNSLFGFLKRYWYIVLPLVLANLLPAEPPQEQGGEQQQQRRGQQQQQQQHPQQGQGRPAVGAGSPPQQPKTRRSKRG